MPTTRLNLKYIGQPIVPIPKGKGSMTQGATSHNALEFVLKGVDFILSVTDSL